MRINRLDSVTMNKPYSRSQYPLYKGYSVPVLPSPQQVHGTTQPGSNADGSGVDPYGYNVDTRYIGNVGASSTVSAPLQYVSQLDEPDYGREYGREYLAGRKSKG